MPYNLMPCNDCNAHTTWDFQFKSTLIYYDYYLLLCVCVIISKRSFEPVMCLDLVIERQQSFVFPVITPDERFPTVLESFVFGVPGSLLDVRLNGISNY